MLLVLYTGTKPLQPTGDVLHKLNEAFLSTQAMINLYRQGQIISNFGKQSEWFNLLTRNIPSLAVVISESLESAQQARAVLRKTGLFDQTLIIQADFMEILQQTEEAGEPE